MAKQMCINCGSKLIEIKEIRPRMTLKDGTTLSVQVGESLYCTPRDNDGPWTHVEVGFIQDKAGNLLKMSDEWREWADGSFEGNTSDVYAWVPVEVVEKFIQEHGGRVTWS